MPATTSEARTTFYRDVMCRLKQAGVPFLLGGGTAYTHYAGVDRGMKDLDIFLREQDITAALDLLAQAGYETEMPFPHWLGKIKQHDWFVDLIFSSGNGVSRVDDLWFHFSEAGRVLDIDVRLCPVEEMIWSKAFVQERERFDGADVLHLIRARGASLDWMRLLTRFDRHWRVLFSHLVLFEFVYPAEREAVPDWVVRELIRRWHEERPAALKDDQTPDDRICQGTLLSRSQYLFDIGPLGYGDARIEPEGSMTREEVDIWTAAIERPPSP